MIKAIFFDAAGILYTRSGHTEEFAVDLLQKNGFPTSVTPEEMETQLDLRSKANDGTLSHEKYWDQFLQQRKVTDPDQRKRMIKQITDYSNDIDPVPGAKEALAVLRERGFNLGIITDTMYPLEWKMKRLKKAGVAEFINIIACSTELGAHKPDPLVYRYAVEQAKLTPADTAFVGHLGSELDGAHQAGMTTIAINYDPGTQADFLCQSIGLLPSLPIFQAGV